jgi:pheromone shutdown protein TraB
MTKKLMLIPIVHSEKEMGSLKSDISEMIDRKFGKEKRDQHRKDVALFWETLRTLVEAITHNVDCTTIRIFQDGIPIGGEVGVKLVRMGAEDGIPNNQILLSIIERGGVLEKTESPALLKEEYDIIKSVVNAKTDEEREALSEKFKNRLYELTIERDRYIAERIHEALKDGMLGLLFIGATHDVAQYLDPDIDLLVCNFVEKDIIAWVKNSSTAPPTPEQAGNR